MAGRLYDKRSWHRLRKRIRQAEPYCRPCFEAGRLTPAVAIHHEIAVKDDPTRAFDPSNLVPLCLNCHALIERKIERGYATEFGLDGMPLDPRHPCYAPRPVKGRPGRKA
jgi:hypothetical protein